MKKLILIPVLASMMLLGCRKEVKQEPPVSELRNTSFNSRNSAGSMCVEGEDVYFLGQLLNRVSEDELLTILSKYDTKQQKLFETQFNYLDDKDRRMNPRSMESYEGNIYVQGDAKHWGDPPFLERPYFACFSKDRKRLWEYSPGDFVYGITNNFKIIDDKIFWFTREHDGPTIHKTLLHILSTNGALIKKIVLSNNTLWGTISMSNNNNELILIEGIDTLRILSSSLTGNLIWERKFDLGKNIDFRQCHLDGNSLFIIGNSYLNAGTSSQTVETSYLFEYKINEDTLTTILEESKPYEYRNFQVIGSTVNIVCGNRIKTHNGYSEVFVRKINTDKTIDNLQSVPEMDSCYGLVSAVYPGDILVLGGTKKGKLTIQKVE